MIPPCSRHMAEYWACQTLSFEASLKHLMRQDPDVILIGEMRDETSVRTALLAASGADILACETIPSHNEMRALAQLMAETPNMPAWPSQNKSLPASL